MICPKCQTANPDRHRYCSQCGTRLGERQRRASAKGSVSDMMARGIAHFNEGAFHSALEEFRACGKMDPLHALSRLYGAACNLALGELGQAREATTGALELAPDLQGAQFLLGMLEALEEEKLAASHHFAECYELNPEFVLPLYWAGLLLIQEKKFTQARPIVERLLSKKPDSAAALYMAGVLDLEEENTDSAITKLEGAVSLLDDFTAAHRRLAQAYMVLRQKENAARHYKRVIELDKHDARSAFELGVILGDLREIDAAVDTLRRALSIDPELAEAHYQIGLLLYVEKGAIDEALTEVEKALELDPTDPSARLILGELLYDKKRMTKTKRSAGRR